MDDTATSIQLNITKSNGPRVKTPARGKGKVTGKRSTVPSNPTLPPILEPVKSKTIKVVDEFDGLNGLDQTTKKVKSKKINSRETGKLTLKDFKTSFVPSLFTHNPEAPPVHLKKVKPVKESLFTKKSFTDLGFLHPHLVSCLQSRLGVQEMTQVQQLSIPPLIEGKDCLIKSATGSGKTLAYLLPIVQKLQEIRPKLQRSDGIHCLIIVPTRELVVQCYQTLSDLCKSFTWLVPGCLMGGEKKKSEKSRIRKGLTFLVATPGRLFDHIEHTSNLHLNKLRYLVIDEADRLKEQGFEEAIGQIINHLKNVCETRPQSVLLSATLSKTVQDLAGMTLDNPVVIDLSDQNSTETEHYALPSQLNLHFMIVPAKLRLISLCSFIVTNCSKKMLKALIFMTTQDSVDFHHALFTNLFLPYLANSDLTQVKFFRLHGNMEQQDRMSVFSEFTQARAGILLCTDVAARGLDLPQVDWIVQYSCPARVEDFVHRVGRTARIGAKGDALLFLLPSEIEFLTLLQETLQVNFNETKLEEMIKSLLFVHLKGKFLGTRNPREYAAKLQQDFEKAIYEDECLLELGKKAYLAYLRSYASYPKDARKILPFKDLHIGHIATSFCLHDTPKELGASAFLMKSKQLNEYRSDNRPKYRDSDRNRPRKRNLPFELRASEFDAGFDSIASSNKKPKMRRK